MLVKYGELDVTDRLLEYKFSGAFASGYLIGNVPTLQLNLKFDNYDGILDDLDINEYWEVQETEISLKRYFKVYDQPEKYTKTLSLKLYDDAHELDVAYDTKLTYPTTVAAQIEEMGTLTGFTFDISNLPEDVLNKEVAWYDNTIAIRNYLGWIAEIGGCNLFASGKKSFSFELLTNAVFATTDTLTNYEKNELYKLTRVYAENGINPLTKGDTTGNTLFLDSNNLYITDDQSIVDRIYSQLNGLQFYSIKSVDMISINNLLPGKLINYNNEFNFMVIDLENTFKGGEFLYCSVDGTVTTKNEERVIKRISNSTRIRKLQIKQDQEKLKLDILAQDIDDTNEKVGELTVSNEKITSKVEQLEGNFENLDIILSDTEPEEPAENMKWADSSVQPPVLKIWKNDNWIEIGNYSSDIGNLESRADSVSAEINQTKDDISMLVEKTNVTVNGNELSLKEYVEDMKIDLEGITNSLSIREGNNLIRDSIGCFSDGSWGGDYDLDATNEVRSLNQYGYALLLKNDTLSQNINVANGLYTISFKYKKLITLANIRIRINDVEFTLSNSDMTDFIYTFEVQSGVIELSFISDTDDACTIINLMCNRGNEKLQWSFNQNETWTDTVKIGRGVRISSSGTDVEFVAYADVIGFVDRSGEYITTFDKNGIVTNEAVIKNKATVVNVLIQDINGQTTFNRIGGEH